MPRPQILWIDDDPGYVNSSIEFFNQNEIDIDVATNLDDVSKAYEKGKAYDAMIIDLQITENKPFVEKKESHSAMVGVKLLEDLIYKNQSEIPELILTSPFVHSKKIRGIYPEHKFINKKNLTSSNFKEIIDGIISDSFDPLYDFIEPSEKADTIIKIDFNTVNRELLNYLAKNPAALHHLSSRKFEELVAQIFSDLGYDVIMTPQTRDGGFDLQAVTKGDLGEIFYIIECKKYAPNKPVGVGHLRSLYGVKQAMGATKASIVTTSFFSKPAKDFQDTIKYELSLEDYSVLKKWIKKYDGDFVNSK